MTLRHACQAVLSHPRGLLWPRWRAAVSAARTGVPKKHWLQRAAPAAPYLADCVIAAVEISLSLGGVSGARGLASGAGHGGVEVDPNLDFTIQSPITQH